MYLSFMLLGYWLSQLGGPQIENVRSPIHCSWRWNRSTLMKRNICSSGNNLTLHCYYFYLVKFAKSFTSIYTMDHGCILINVDGTSLELPKKWERTEKKPSCLRIRSKIPEVFPVLDVGQAGLVPSRRSHRRRRSEMTRSEPFIGWETRW